MAVPGEADSGFTIQDTGFRRKTKPLSNKPGQLLF
jgi:hypothetical protein